MKYLVSLTPEIDELLGFRSAVYALCGPNSAEYAAVNEVLEAVEAVEAEGGDHAAGR